MKKTILVCLLVVCVSISDAQIRTQHEYDYVGTESNNAGLRVVGKRTKIVGAQEDKWGRWQKYDQELNLYGCINKDGYEIVPLKYKEVTISKEANYIIVVTPAQVDADNYAVPQATGLLSEDGSRTIINPYYKHILMEPTIFKTLKCAIFVSQKDHYGIVNNRAEEIVSPIYENMYWINREKGYLAVKLNGRWGVVDYLGREIAAMSWNYMGRNNSDEEPIAVVKDNLLGFVDSYGKMIIPLQYYYPSIEYDDLKNKIVGNNFLKKICIVIDYNYKYGAINTDNEIVIPFIYDNLSNFNGWTMWGEKDKRYYLLSKQGEKLCDMGNRKGLYIGNCREGVQQIRVDKRNSYKWFYFDYKGNKYSSHDEAKAANNLIEEKENENEKKLATISWLSNIGFIFEQGYELNIGIKSDSKIETAAISVNGILDRGIKTIECSEYGMTINKMITLSEGKNVIKVSVKNAAGTTQEEKTIVYRPQGGELPTIEWLDFAATANKKEYQMKLGIKSKSKIEEVNVTLNGNQSRGIKTVQADGYDLTVDRTLALSEGVNRIVVSVRNGDGIATSEKVITYQGINPTPMFNDKRIAFVVGNSHYSRSEMNLTNPENDAKDVAEKLKGLGFEVVLKLDATLETMDKELSSFKEKAKDYDVAMFYYAGHGIQSKGVNYIVPTNIDNLAEDNMKYKCVDMERVLDVMEDSHCKLKIVILDACRNDPLSRRWHRSAGTRGLSIMSAPTGTIISYSTAPGKTALDGEGRNSPYTEAFLYSLDMPNLDVFHFFQKVGAEVKRKTKDSQDPWWSSSFTGDFYFNKQ